MTPRARSIAGLSLLASVLFAAPAFAAWPHSPNVNVPVAVIPFSKQQLVACSDGAGGILCAWADSRSGTMRIYANKILGDGTLAPGWPTTGVQLYTFSTTRTQSGPVICTDGAGGAIVAWNEIYSGSDVDVDTQHILANGTLGWGTAGVAVCSLGDLQENPTIVPDGSNGAFIAWVDRRSGSNFDIYAQHLTAGGTIAAGSWVGQGLAVCTAVSDQVSPAMCRDGFGGIDLCWLDTRGPQPYAIFTQRLTAAGTLPSGWVANGNSILAITQGIGDIRVVPNAYGGGLYVWSDSRSGNYDVYCTSMDGSGNVIGYLGGGAICSAAGSQNSLAVVSDNSGGAYVAWNDLRSGESDIYAQRITGSGGIASGWPTAANALAVCTVAGSQAGVGMVSDGIDGALLFWADARTGPRYDVYATHLMGNSTVAEGWNAYWNTPVCTADGDQVSVAAVTDGASGAIAAWLDGRTGALSYSDVYAQRIERFGQLGNPEPALVNVRDVPNDQGGNVRVSWNASYMDVYPTYGVSAYWLWRQAPASLALAAMRQGARLVSVEEDASRIPGRVFRAVSTTDAWYWEYVSSQVANGFPSYSVVTPTTSDSIGAGNPRTVFMIEARGGGNVHWDSAPDSGYSVDNLPPVVPAPFLGAYASGAAHLHWGPNHESDLAGYRLYKGVSGGFVPGPGNLVVAQPDTGYADVGAAGFYYKLSAVDIHGNESPFALLTPGGTTAAGEVPAELRFWGAAPNPIRDDAIIRWALPRSEHVSLEIVDPAGRVVRRLVDGVQPAGNREALWNTRDGAGRTVPSGIYFIRLEAEGRTLTSRVATIR